MIALLNLHSILSSSVFFYILISFVLVHFATLTFHFSLIWSEALLVYEELLI